MHILYLEWNSFCNEDMFCVLTEMGHTVIKVPFENTRLSETEVENRLNKYLKNTVCDFVFSFNYFPPVSNCCKRMGLRYVAWVYDNPYLNVYSYTILNACNYIFLFDFSMYQELKSAGIETVYYLPMAVYEKRLAGLQNTETMQRKYAADVSFLGSLYIEPKHRLYDKFASVAPFAKGYLDGLIQAQLHISGYNFLQEMLTPDVVAEMQKAYPTDPNAATVATPEQIYADYVLSRQVTALERREILRRIGETHPVTLYTYEKDVQIPGVKNRGMADYYDEMPYIFMNSKINLNISLRSIKTGIPLRAMDIMGCGGFLLTNYQAELFEYFEADKDFVYYTDYEDLVEKVDYYLAHEEERKQIAASGCHKVREQHTLQKRVEYILQVLAEDEHEAVTV